MRLAQSYDTKHRPTNIVRTIMLLARELNGLKATEEIKQLKKELKTLWGKEVD